MASGGERGLPVLPVPVLPVHDVLPEIMAALSDGNRAVLSAPPGAGKTTIVPLVLLDQPWCSGKIILLEPRRLAARAAAGRMAALLGEQVGETVGYRMRLDNRISGRTRIEVVTEGVFARMVLEEPELAGISAVIFDEFHERSLDADFGLALALDVQSALREDLRVLVMSATLDVERVAALLDHPPVIVSEGRSFPVEIRHRDRPTGERIEDSVTSAILAAHGGEEGSILAFLPGQGEILRTAERLEGRFGPETLIAPLYGNLSQADQDLAIRPACSGCRCSSPPPPSPGWKRSGCHAPPPINVPGAPAVRNREPPSASGMPDRRRRSPRSRRRRSSPPICPSWRSTWRTGA